MTFFKNVVAVGKDSVHSILKPPFHSHAAPDIG